MRKIGLTSYEKGYIEGQREMLLILLEGRFGPLSPAVPKRLAALSVERLVEVRKALLTADSLKNLGLAN